VNAHFANPTSNDPAVGRTSGPADGPAIGPANGPATTGSFLRDRRTSRALTTTDVARELGVHPTSVLRWERRERLPGPEHIHGLARSLSVDPTAVACFFDEVRPVAPPPPANPRGHGLRPLRRAARVPAVRIAEVVGVPAASIYNWEAGRARIPVQHVPALADLLRRHAAIDVPSAAGAALRPAGGCAAHRLSGTGVSSHAIAAR
jgi:transcriptional regulator with XRE-family HTH domain